MAKRDWESVKSQIDVSRETFERLTIYHDLLVQWQKRINLISPKTVDDIWSRHIIDSLQLFPLVSKARSFIDIGSGAGFPGLIFSILLAELNEGRVDLIESNGKKCAFMNAVVRECGLKAQGVEVVVHHNRIEEKIKHLAQPDVVSARALAPLKDLLGLTDCFLSKGSVGLFPKGRDHAAEIDQAKVIWSFDCQQSKSLIEDGSVILKISNLSHR